MHLEFGRMIRRCALPHTADDRRTAFLSFTRLIFVSAVVFVSAPFFQLFIIYCIEIQIAIVSAQISVGSIVLSHFHFAEHHRFNIARPIGIVMDM
jgi:hypothetical protein